MTKRFKKRKARYFEVSVVLMQKLNLQMEFMQKKLDKEQSFFIPRNIDEGGKQRLINFLTLNEHTCNFLFTFYLKDQMVLIFC